MTDETEAYREIYLVEAKENLEALNSLLVDLERSPSDIEVINSIFRIAHTFKGMSSTMGYIPVATLTHRMETTLDGIRKGSTQVNERLIDLMFKCMDAIEAMTEEIDNEQAIEYDIEPLLEMLDSISSTAGPDEPPAEIVATDESGVAEDLDRFDDDDTDPIADGDSIWEITIAPSCDMTSIRLFQIKNGITQLGSEIVRSHPTFDEAEKDGKQRLVKLHLRGVSREDIASVLSGIGEISFRELEVWTSTSEEASESTIGDRSDGPSETDRTSTDTDRARETSRKRTTHIRVNLSHLDNLMNLIGELVINKGRLLLIAEKIKDKELLESLDPVNRITSELQERIMAARMIPLDFHFNRFPRMVRDLAKKLEKDIEFKVTGGDIELDRTVIDEIGDPLVHLLRNAVDHGIESAPDRAASGKPARGLVSLSAAREKNTVVISVSDDGKGLDPERLKSSALRKGVITQEQASIMSDDEAKNLIFAPGFSTAETVTDTSGRGVGMDAVYHAMSAIGGQISVRSEIGAGTTVSMSLPITMAIVQSLLIEAGSERFAVPFSSVKEILDMKDYPVSRVVDGMVIVVRNKSIPLVTLGSLFSRSPTGNLDRRTGPVVLIEHSNREMALMVDSLLGQQEIVIKSFGESLQGVFGLAGATILGDGSVILILDMHSLVSSNSGNRNR